MVSGTATRNTPSYHDYAGIAKVLLAIRHGPFSVRRLGDFSWNSLRISVECSPIAGTAPRCDGPSPHIAAGATIRATPDGVSTAMRLSAGCRARSAIPLTNPNAVFAARSLIVASCGVSCAKTAAILAFTAGRLATRATFDSKPGFDDRSAS